jgi:hypothetical protein
MFGENMKYRVARMWKIRLLCHRIRRAFEFAVFSWQLHDFDWSSVAELMILQLGKLQLLTANGMSSDRDRNARQIQITINLLHRMVDDTAWDMSERRYPSKGYWWVKQTKILEKQQDEMLGKMLTKYFRHWWE